MGNIKDRERRVADRKEIQTKIEFFVNADIISAQSLDMSETGVRFDTKEPIKVHMRMKIDGKSCDREGQFVWAVTNSDGGMTYGLEFIADPEEYMF